jgi:dethiobiotin synthetase
MASVKGHRKPRILFITGTDTGVGKTLLTALLLSHLRQAGERAWALKPFCSGGREDAELLYELQDRELTLEEVNPWHYEQPVAPLAAAGRHSVPRERVLAHVHRFSRQCEWLLVEGAGGLFVPLGTGYTVHEVIRGLQCKTVVVSRNRLGTINHTLLTVHALKAQIGAGKAPSVKVVMMQAAKPDPSSHRNATLLQSFLGHVPLLEIPFLGPRCSSVASVRGFAKKLQKTLARIRE